MSAISVFGLMAVMSVGTGLIVYLIAADRQRFLARFDLSQWNESYYQRALPNFLQALHDNHFKSPWPARRNAVAAGFFKYRARALLKKLPKKRRRAFLQQHITLFALLDTLSPFLQDFLLSEQQRIAGQRLLEMEDTVDRDRLLAFLELSRQHRDVFFRSLTDYDRNILAQIIDRRFLATLRFMHANYQEHGYALMPEFTQLRRWEEMNGVELAQDLPELPRAQTGRPKRAVEETEPNAIGEL